MTKTPRNGDLGEQNTQSFDLNQQYLKNIMINTLQQGSITSSHELTMLTMVIYVN